MDTDIRDEIDRSFGDGPAFDDTASLLDHGHRALRRRRLASGGAMVAVAAVVVTASVALGGGSGDTSGTPVAPPSATPSPEVPSETPQDTSVDGVVLVPDSSLPRSAAVEVAPDGSVHVRPDVQVTVAIPDPYEQIDLTTSAAAIYLVDGEPFWYVGYLGAHGDESAVRVPAQDGVTFQDWVAGMEPVEGSGSGATSGEWPGRVDLQLVRFTGHTERLEPVGAVTLLEQRPHPEVGDSFATARDRSAVAEVRFEGERYYVLARSLGSGAAQYIAVSAADGGATLDDFLDLARSRYAEGGGGLL